MCTVREQFANELRSVETGSQETPAPTAIPTAVTLPATSASKCFVIQAEDVLVTASANATPFTGQEGW